MCKKAGAVVDRGKPTQVTDDVLVSGCPIRTDLRTEWVVDLLGTVGKRHGVKAVDILP